MDSIIKSTNKHGANAAKGPQGNKRAPTKLHKKNEITHKGWTQGMTMDIQILIKSKSGFKDPMLDYLFLQIFWVNASSQDLSCILELYVNNNLEEQASFLNKAIELSWVSLHKHNLFSAVFLMHRYYLRLGPRL